MKRHLDFLIGVPLLRLLSWIPERPRAPVPDPKRILVIKLAAFGDSVLLIPALRALRHAYPSADIDWLCSPVNSALASLVPYVTRTLVLKSFGPGALFPLCRELRRSAYDGVIDFEQWARGTALLAWATGAPWRAGFQTPAQHRSALFTRTYAKTFAQHERDEFLSLLSAALPMVKSQDRQLELWESAQGKRQLEEAAPELVKSPRDFRAVVLHPGCGADGKARQWPVEKYVELAKALRARPSTRLYVTGGPDETRLASSLAAKVPGSIQLAGRLSWQGVLSLLKRVDLLVSGNTGVMHVAAAWQTKQIALHGPTNPRLWGPINPRAVVLSSNCPQCPTLKLGFEYHATDSTCMDRISVQEVLAAAQGLLAN